MATNNVINLKKPVPAFQADNFDSQSSVTGDGTIYQVLFSTSIFNNDTSYSTATSIFTAPRTGLYTAYIAITVGDAADGNLLRFYVTADGIVYELMRMNPTNICYSANMYADSYSITFPMVASSTAVVYAVGSGGTKTVSIMGEDDVSYITPSFSVISVTGL